jgi:hypothetical protein
MPSSMRSLLDFFLGLATFHVPSAGAGIVAASGRVRPAGRAPVGLVVALGVLT